MRCLSVYKKKKKKNHFRDKPLLENLDSLFQFGFWRVDPQEPFFLLFYCFFIVFSNLELKQNVKKKKQNKKINNKKYI